MNKELKEAKKYLEHEVNVYENNKEINQLIGGKSGEMQHKRNITLLNYIENSIPKEVIEKKIEELKKQSGGNVFHIQQTINAKIRLLQELLEEK